MQLSTIQSLLCMCAYRYLDVIYTVLHFDLQTFTTCRYCVSEFRYHLSLPPCQLPSTSFLFRTLSPSTPPAPLLFLTFGSPSTSVSAPDWVTSVTPPSPGLVRSPNERTSSSCVPESFPYTSRTGPYVFRLDTFGVCVGPQGAPTVRPRDPV